jgi:hypothetical protein
MFAVCGSCLFLCIPVVREQSAARLIAPAKISAAACSRHSHKEFVPQRGDRSDCIVDSFVHVCAPAGRHPSVVSVLQTGLGCIALAAFKMARHWARPWVHACRRSRWDNRRLHFIQSMAHSDAGNSRLSTMVPLSRCGSPQAFNTYSGESTFDVPGCRGAFANAAADSSQTK